MLETQEAPTPKENLLKYFRLMREANLENPMPDLEKRKDRLQRLFQNFLLIICTSQDLNRLQRKWQKLLQKT